MKKIVLPIVFSLFITSCNDKKNENEEIIISGTEQVNVAFQLKEYTAKDVMKMLNQKNDTLYVANFFATWCGPCVRELPHFRSKMEETKGQPVKFIFVNLDAKADWETEVKKFVAEKGIAQQTILVDGEQLTPELLKKNFQKWDGGSIPFTFMRKGNQVDETIGMIQKYDLDRKMKKLQ